MNTAESHSEMSIYSQISDACVMGDLHGAVGLLISHLENSQQYHELFEALKMRLRLQLGLPAAQAEYEDKLDEERESRFEAGLLDACKKVGEHLLSQGKIREGWMYMRPIGDREMAARLLSQVEANDENVDELLEVLLHEGVDIARGYALALSRLGTCNSITLFESALAAKPRSDQQVAARLLVRHVHQELLENLKRDIANREGSEPPENSLAELLRSRPEWLRDGTYHLDTSHIASTVRFARVLDDRDGLQLALDIAEYGRQLHPQFQYPGEEPFLDLYPASVAFFRALLGHQVDSGIRYFTQKADSVDPSQFGTIAVEVLIDLLSRCNRHAEAMATYRKRLPATARTMGVAPSLLQLSQRLGQFSLMQDICEERGDLLGFAAAALQPNRDSQNK